jgi:hypothetical protein
MSTFSVQYRPILAEKSGDSIQLTDSRNASECVIHPPVPPRQQKIPLKVGYDSSISGLINLCAVQDGGSAQDLQCHLARNYLHVTFD